MLSVKNELLQTLSIVLEQLLPGAGARAAFESPKLAEHGDLATTAAMQIAKALKQPPRQVAEELRRALLATPAFAIWVEALEIAGPGFINIRLKPAAKQEIVREVLGAGPRYGHRAPQLEKGQRMMVEFVSANPTGPLHVGHGRQAALGDAISNLYATQGWEVYREFYYNDAGVQIQTLAVSVQARARGLKPGDAGWPESAYNGDYIADIAADFMAGKTVQADDRSYTASGKVDDLDGMRLFAVAYLRHEQDLDLQAFNLRFDNYYLESSLYTSGRVDAAVEKLRAAGKTYEQDGALWLRSTDYGDDKDRVMRKGDGSYTYFVPDVAYHISKWERGFQKVVNIQGTDHHGTIARVRAGLQAAGVGIPEGYPDYVLHTMVRVVRGGEEVKISKRAGSYVTLRDLIEWTSKDAVRFFLLSRKPDTEYTFDVDLAVQKNNDNPVYYVQYAHARICSVLATWKDKDGGDPATLREADLAALDTPAAHALMLKLAQYPDMLTGAAKDFAPHDVAFYLRDLAASYHSYYDAERILVEDEAVKRARLALVAATAQVLRNGLAVLGVSAPEKM
ncbi:arginine--tRNA ligase [Hylemonella gracilis str. Niagara R]|uniref:Arginine--tRNA ligase n=1 Tax=Hylemonella gracilis str. Niagara R TaxID=1458275 RepID=A0A016XEY4_9BURK|nr:arginine--tRNA ligase [Hylemonella gracilis]EYC50102.1 arginine--tRNA ligase [Hylemonella gracilis str. Niagara R]